MLVGWATDEGELYTAQGYVGPNRLIHLAAESLGETGWDWQVWDAAMRDEQRYGLANTLDEAKVKAEAALAGMTHRNGLQRRPSRDA